MALLTNGYWNRKYFAENYYQDDYWSDYGAVPEEYLLLALSHEYPLNMTLTHGYPLAIALSEETI